MSLPETSVLDAIPGAPFPLLSTNARGLPSPFPHQAAETAEASPQGGCATPACRGSGGGSGRGSLAPGRSCGDPGGDKGWVLLSVCAAPSALEARGGAEGTSRVSSPQVPPRGRPQIPESAGDSSQSASWRQF